MTGKRPVPPADAHPVAANDNLPPISKEAEAALDRIARAIGRHIAREMMEKRRGENDNEDSR